MSDLIRTFTERGDLAHLALFLWASAASAAFLFTLRELRMGFVRAAAAWVGTVGRYTPFVGAYFEALDQIDEFNRLAAMIKTANDPPLTLEELQANAQLPSQLGYHTHHIDEQSTMGSLGYSTAEINSPDNLARISELKHIDITAWYARGNEKFGGLSPREYLRSQPQSVRRQIGLDTLRDFGALKP